MKIKILYELEHQSVFNYQKKTALSDSFQSFNNQYRRKEVKFIINQGYGLANSKDMMEFNMQKVLQGQTWFNVVS